MRPNSNNIENDKIKKLFCTCSKSGCKLKYCECYKNGLECTDLCRCTKCENTKIPNEKNNFILKMCYANSIYVIDNILKEDLKRTHFKKKKEKKLKIVKILKKMKMKMILKIKKMKIHQADFLIKMEI